MKALILSITMASLTFFSVITYAADQNEAYDLFCKPLTFSSDRTNCTNIIRKYTNFDTDAMAICEPMTFTSEKLKCLDAIGNKNYLKFEITECNNETFESGKISCLIKSGTTSSGNLQCQLNSKTEQLFKSMLFDLRSGNTNNVDQQLQRLIIQSKNCPN